MFLIINNALRPLQHIHYENFIKTHQIQHSKIEIFNQLIKMLQYFVNILHFLIKIHRNLFIPQNLNQIKRILVL